MPVDPGALDLWQEEMQDIFQRLKNAADAEDMPVVLREYEAAVRNLAARPAGLDDIPAGLRISEGWKSIINQLGKKIVETASPEDLDQIDLVFQRLQNADLGGEVEIPTVDEIMPEGMQQRGVKPPKAAPGAPPAGSEGARELGKSVRGAQLTPEQQRMDPQAQARHLAAQRALERAEELKPRQGPLERRPFGDAAREAMAKAQDPSEYIMEAERPWQVYPPEGAGSISDEYRGSRGGITGDEDDLFRTLLKGSRSDLRAEVEAFPKKFGFLVDEPSSRTGRSYLRPRDLEKLDDLSTSEMRSELTNRYLEKARQDLGGPARWDRRNIYEQGFVEATERASELAEDIANWSEPHGGGKPLPPATVGEMGDEAMEFAVDSRAFERMVNAAKGAGIQLGDDILKVAKGLGKAGLKAVLPAAVGLSAYEAKRGLETGDVGRTIEGVTGGIMHPIVGGAVRAKWPSQEVQAAEAGEEIKADIIEGDYQSPYHQKLQQDIDRQEQVSGWLKEGVPMHEIRRRVSSGALAREEEPLVPLGPTGPSIKSAE